MAIALTLEALLMGMASPAHRTHANGRVGSGCAQGIGSTRIKRCTARVGAAVVNTCLLVTTFRVSLTLSLFDCKMEKNDAQGQSLPASLKLLNQVKENILGVQDRYPSPVMPGGQ